MLDERDYGNLTRCFSLMISEKGVLLYYAGPQLLPLLTLRDNGGSIVGPGPDLNGHFGMSHKVMIPVRMLRCAYVGGDYEQAIAIGYVHHRCCVGLSTFSANCCEQEQGPTTWAFEFAPICSEFFDQLMVIVGVICHDFSS